MGSTYSSLHYHVVFGTKSRASDIDPSWRARLHEYLGGTLRGLGGLPLKIGGPADHVHGLIGLPTTQAVAGVVREWKKASSVWVHQEMGNRQFAWQEGYAVFTVSSTACRDVSRYIENQAEHHRKKSFREEVAEMLVKAGVAFDPRYLPPLRGE